MERTDAVGLRECPGGKEFAHWDVSRTPAFRLELEVGAQQLNIGDVSVPFASEHFDNRYELTLADLSNRTSFFFRPRFSISLHRNFYLGVAASMGGTGRDTGETTRPIRAHVTSMITLGARVFAGVSAPIGHRWQFNGEVALGVRTTVMTIETREADCVNEINKSMSDLVVTGRLGFDRFVSPALSFGGFVGYDPLQREATFGLRMSAHGRAYDAQRRATPTTSSR